MTNMEYMNINNVVEKINLDKKEVFNDPIEKWYNAKDYEELYEVSNKGRVRNKKTKKIMKQFIVSKYLTVGLKKNGENKTIRVNRLIQKSIVGLPEGRKVVDHIDNNKLNNESDNLQWLTYAENSQAFVDNHKKIKYRKINQYDINNNLIKEWDNINDIMKEHGFAKSPIALCLTGARDKGYGYIWKYKDYAGKIDNINLKEDEEFKNLGTIDDYDFSDYECSNYGNVWSNKTNQYLATVKGEYITIVIYDNINKKKHNFTLHFLVALLFIGEKGNNDLVNHIDEDKHNNYYKNLEWRTFKENAEHSFAKTVEQIDVKTGKILNTYKSLTEAGETMFKTQHSKTKGCSSISVCCKGKQHTAFGYKWKFKEE